MQNLLSCAGVAINGDQSHDITVHNELLYPRVLTYLELGLGESYMDQWFDCERLDEFFVRVLSAGLEKRVKRRKKVF